MLCFRKAVAHTERQNIVMEQLMENMLSKTDFV